MDIIAIYVPCALSIAGGVFMLTSFCMFKDLRTTFGSYSMWFAISGIGASMYPVFGTPRDGSALCYSQVFFGHYFVLSSLFTSTILVKTIFRLFYPLTNERAGSAKLQVNTTTILYAWGLPALLYILPFFTNSYGLDDGNM